MSDDREWLWYILTSIPDVGPVTIRKLLECLDSPEEVLELTPDDFCRLGVCSKRGMAGFSKAYSERNKIRKEYEGLERRGIRFISIEHKDYPDKLRTIPDAPYGLWIKGELPKRSSPSAAIIGSRGCSQNGIMMAARLGEALVRLGVQVISGMAIGIDAAAQWGALNKGGYTLGVLGGGVDVCYPRVNLDLYDALTKRGGIISEAAPGSPPVAARFRLRNRLISGMSDCVIVVEAREKSGTQITVSTALDQGREVFALPGRITDPLSRGCNQMISQGARILWDFEELAEFFGCTPDSAEKRDTMPALTQLERLVFDKLTDEPKHLEDILAETGLPVGEAMEALIHLEIKGVVFQGVKNYYRRCINI